MAHTPAPWYIGTGAAQNAAMIRRDPKRGQAIAQVFYTIQQPESLGGCGMANAALVAAAPDLLAACKAALAQAELTETLPMPWVVQARAAIAKAVPE